jgi:hypothetical protein
VGGDSIYSTCNVTRDVEATMPSGSLAPVVDETERLDVKVLGVKG